MVLVSALFLLIRSLIVPRTSLVAENLALRQQLAVLNRKIHRPQLHRRDRFFCVTLSRFWKNWREVLIIVKPETVIRWHRQGFKLYWRWKSKAPVGRPKIDKEIRELIRKMSRENPVLRQNLVTIDIVDFLRPSATLYRYEGITILAVLLFQSFTQRAMQFGS
jgi:putative transposase